MIVNTKGVMSLGVQAGGGMSLIRCSCEALLLLLHNVGGILAYPYSLAFAARLTVQRQQHIAQGSHPSRDKTRWPKHFHVGISLIFLWASAAFRTNGLGRSILFDPRASPKRVGARSADPVRPSTPFRHNPTLILAGRPVSRTRPCT